MLLNFIIIFFLGYLGFRISKLLHLPGGNVTGPLLLLALVTSQGVEWAELPSFINTLFQVIIGIMIGCRFGKDKLSTIKEVLVPGLFSSLWIIIFSLAMGFFLAKFTFLEVGTALYASVPAGLAEMGLIALMYNLNVPVVVLFQFVRVISINLSVPFIVFKYNNKKSDTETKYTHSKPIILESEKDKEEKVKRLEVLITLILGGIGGFLAKYWGMPVGGMLGAMLVIGSLKTIGVALKEPPEWLFLVAQIGLGSYLGTSFTREVVLTLQNLLFPVMVFSLLVVINGLLIGFLLHRFIGWDLTTALLSTAVGGASLMTIVALELDADAVKVSILQSIRLIIILLIMPTLILYIIR
ncbi:MAG: hypothetical protein Kow00103_10730 [Candidatus Caldatribacteriota bacterium]